MATLANEVCPSWDWKRESEGGRGAPAASEGEQPVPVPGGPPCLQQQRGLRQPADPPGLAEHLSAMPQALHRPVRTLPPTWPCLWQPQPSWLQSKCPWTHLGLWKRPHIGVARRGGQAPLWVWVPHPRPRQACSERAGQRRLGSHICCSAPATRPEARSLLQACWPCLQAGGARTKLHLGGASGQWLRVRPGGWLPHRGD